MKNVPFFLLIIIALLVVSWSKSDVNPTPEKIKIGEQIWMSHNLNVDTFSNGEKILNAKTAEEWQNAITNEIPAWCYYNNDSTLGAKYGKLYNWYAVNDPRGLTPASWFISEVDDWEQLYKFVGYATDSVAKLKSKSDWANNTYGTDAYGFCAYPGGTRNQSGAFIYLGENTAWWTNDNYSEKNAYGYELTPENEIVRIFPNTGEGLYVRCLTLIEKE